MKPLFISMAILITLSATSRSFADAAKYDVTLAGSNVTIKIDTNPWLAGEYAKTAVVKVTYRMANGGTAIRSYDFLKDATSPDYLERGHVYGRMLPSDVPGATQIIASRLTYSAETGKTDEDGLAGKQADVGSPDFSVTSASDNLGVEVPPPPVAWHGMTREAQVNRNLMDYHHQGVSSVTACMELCANDPRCRAYTTGESGGMCWLKDGVPPPTPCGNCVSGVKK